MWGGVPQKYTNTDMQQHATNTQANNVPKSKPEQDNPRKDLTPTIHDPLNGATVSFSGTKHHHDLSRHGLSCLP